MGTELTTLRGYQRPHHGKILRALESDHGAVLDASDTGTGKTHVALACCRVLGERPFVVCPKPVVHSWEEASRIQGVELRGICSYEKARGRGQRLNYFNPQIFGPNFRRESSSDYGREIPYGRGSLWKWSENHSLMIFDEVHRCSGNASLQSKMLIAAKRQSERVLCLSATAADDPRQLKALGYALGLHTLRNYKWWLLSRGCVPGRFGGFDWPEDMRDESVLMLHQDIFGSGKGARMAKALIPNFPKTQIETLLLRDTDGKAAALARQIREAHKGKAKLLEIHALRQRLELMKIPDLVLMAKDKSLTSRVVLFVNYRASAAALAKKLKAPVIEGGVSGLVRQQFQDGFQAGKIPILVANSAAAGEGISLHDFITQADITTLISPTFSAKQLRQVFGRVNRDQGGFSQQFLVGFEGTIEEEILKTVMQKSDRLDLLNDGDLI